MVSRSQPVGQNRYRASIGRYYEEFKVGDIYEHRPGRSVTEADNIWFSLLTMNQHDIGQALENPFVAEQERILDFGYPDGRAVRLVASPIRSGDAHPLNAAPAMGAHTEALLAELGYDAERVRALREAGVL